MVDFATIRANLLQHMSPSDRVLVLGSGTSTLPVELRNLGFRPLPLCAPLALRLSLHASRDVLAVDNSPAAVAHMEERHGGSPELKFEVIAGLSGVFGSVAMPAGPSSFVVKEYHGIFP